MEQELRKDIRREMERASNGDFAAPLKVVFLYEQLVERLDRRIQIYEDAHSRLIQTLNSADY
jgi:hypothetical protein